MTDIERIKLMQKIRRIARVHPVATLEARLGEIVALATGKEPEKRTTRRRGSRKDEESPNRLDTSSPDRSA